MTKTGAESNALNLMNLSHHAYCLIGGDSVHEELLATLKNNHKISAAGNADFFDRRYTSFTIADARELKSQAESRPISSSGRRIFILTMNGIIAEAQNALLKLLEEPNERSHFFLIIPSAHLLLPTVKSRLLFIGDKDVASRGYNKDVIAQAKEFIAMPLAKRLDFIKSFMEEITKEKRPKQDAVDLLKALEQIVYEKGVKEKSNIPKLEAVLLAEKYATDRAPSLKMLLEYVALNL